MYFMFLFLLLGLKWEAPPMGKLKISMDYSAKFVEIKDKSNSTSQSRIVKKAILTGEGGGAVIRNHLGEVLRKQVWKNTSGKTNVGELEAFSNSLVWCLNFFPKKEDREKLIFETDSKNLAYVINNGRGYRDADAQEILDKVRIDMTKFNFTSILHVVREKNQTADALANLGRLGADITDSTNMEVDETSKFEFDEIDDYKKKIYQTG
ncbi:PREDICTED: uncharacterized protein LOC105950692 [Erythranthe guttata]|uniref:uncharacterized protein LOC105950692 n=1 Tax=Erythranthe guttata TaxID=4155 RepID=UPI00064DA193|nr:PREDICTED: uncharacterized protein LOC105950692 [Erythranthe guttata]|eukprot:XP_012829513.1 PREDICTED: uncharacterized protein LOC105950692 [Erythranthe guttata]